MMVNLSEGWFPNPADRTIFLYLEFQFRSMGKVDVAFDLAYRLMHPRLTVLVTCIDSRGMSNIITLAWSMPTSIKPPMAAISVAPQRYSHKLISETKEFVVNMPTMQLARETLFCGRNSGRDCNKFRETKLTPMPAKKVAPPLIKECVAHLECKVINSITTGDHTLFVGEVVAASADQGIFDVKYDVEKVKPIYHLGGDDFLTIA
jgi:flavin reductase (DIM6/NTAB) family NADH-FMN oxidoreductase RutF